MALLFAGHGLLFESDIPLVEFAPAEGGSPDIRILSGPLPGEAAAEAERLRAAGPAGIAPFGEGHLIAVRGVADFLVTGGREIRVAPAAGVAEGMLRVWLHGSAMGMVLHQRGTLVLHGAAVAGPRGVAVFVGDSGAGKSTLAARLGREGFPVLGDDTLAVTGGAAEVWPGSRRLKLWRDAAEGLGIPLDGAAALARRVDKFWIDWPDPAPHAPMKLAAIFELTAGAPMRIEPLKLLPATALVAAHTYRPEFVAHTGRHAPHFRQCAALAGKVPVARLVRPWDAGHHAETAAFVARHLRGAG